MIKLEVNNGRSIELTQEKPDGDINVDVLDSNGEVDYFYTITAGDMVMLLNYYQYQKNYGQTVF
jgi:hypothetical protein